MKRYLQKARSKLKFRDLFWPGLNVFTKVLTTGISTKILVSILNPVQYGLFGNYINMFQVLFSPSSTALTNYTVSLCDRKDGDIDSEHLTQFFWLTILLNFLITAGFLALTPLWSFFNVEVSFLWVSVLLLGCFSQPLFSIISAMINGSGQLPRFVRFSSLYGVLSTALTFALLYYFGYPGALWSLLTNGIAVCVLGILGLFKINLSHLIHFTRKSFSKKKYFNFFTMALAGSIIGPVTLIIIRKIIEHYLSATYVGYWQGLQRVSELYMSVVISFIAVLYLPELTVAKNYHQIKQAIYRGIGIVIPVGVLAISTAVFFSEMVLPIFLTKDFIQFASEAKVYFAGDFFRLITFLATYLFIGRAITSAFIVSEILFSVLRIGFYLFFASGGKMADLAQAQFYSSICQAMAGLILLLIFRKRIKYRSTAEYSPVIEE